MRHTPEPSGHPFTHMGSRPTTLREPITGNSFHRMTSLSALRFLVPVCLTLLACGGSSESGDVGRSGEDSDEPDAGGDMGADDDAADDDSADDDSAADDEAADDDAVDDDDAADDDSAADDDAADDDVIADDDPATVPGPIELPETDVSMLAPPEPLLPDTPPETPVSDLDDGEFEELCEPYLDEATTTVSSLEGLCAFSGISAANDSGAATVEEFQAACGEARIQCESDAAAAEVLAGSLECTRPADCTATVAEVDACYQQLYLLNAAILGPLGGTEFPPCEELTPAEAGAITAQVALYLLLTSTQAAEATGTPIDQEGDPCAELEEICPGLGTPAGLTPAEPPDDPMDPEIPSEPDPVPPDAPMDAGPPDPMTLPDAGAN